MPETGCSLLLSLRAVEYRLFGVVQDAFCFEGMIFWALISSLREDFHQQG